MEYEQVAKGTFRESEDQFHICKFLYTWTRSSDGHSEGEAKEVEGKAGGNE